MKSGSVYRKCYCKDPKTGKRLEGKCPELVKRSHGSYGIRQEIPPRRDSSRRKFRRTGYTNGTEAQADLDKVRSLLTLADDNDPEETLRLGDLLERISLNREEIPSSDEVKKLIGSGRRIDRNFTVAEWLTEWLDSKVDIKRNTRTSYEGHIKKHLIPAIGNIQLGKLRVSHVQDMFKRIRERNDEIVENNALRRLTLEAASRAYRHRDRIAAKRLKEKVLKLPPFRKSTERNTQERIKATLRAALNDAIREELISLNVAQLVKLPKKKRQRPLVWTAERIDRWKQTGKKPSPVMIWTPEQLVTFLARAKKHQYFDLYNLAIHTGMRRGEVCGLRWSEVEFVRKTTRSGKTLVTSAVITVSEELLQFGRELEEDDTKSEAGDRQIAVIKEIAQMLARRKQAQEEARAKWADAWVGTDLVFCHDDGSVTPPESVSDQFQILGGECGLPPIRFHDLRHCAGTLAGIGGASDQEVQLLLGHADPGFTKKVYRHLYDEKSTEATAGISRELKKAQRTRGERPGHRSASRSNGHEPAADDPDEGGGGEG